jgi:hypothetical protein
MEVNKVFCPLSGKCSHEFIDAEPNSYFLIEPFDAEKCERERAIRKSLDLFYSEMKIDYKLKVSGSENLQDHGLYCDICYNIRSSQFCIVDITGDYYKVQTESGKIEDKIFLRPNIALELGLAYGFGKPTFVISGVKDGKRIIPSDISFIRYLDNNVNFERWGALSQKFPDLLRDTQPHLNIKAAFPCDINKKELKSTLKHLKSLREKVPLILNTKYEINQILWDEYQIVGIVKNADNLLEGIWFRFYISSNGIEKLAGILKVDHVQPGGLAQVLFYDTEGVKTNYLKTIFSSCAKSKIIIPVKNRLELIIPEEFEYIFKNSGDIELSSIIEIL